MRVCTNEDCNEDRIEMFSVSNMRSDGLQVRCKKCAAEYAREYRAKNPGVEKEVKQRYQSTEKYKLNRKIRDKRYVKKNKERGQAHRAVANAVKDGLLTRPPICSECGLEHDNIQGHHESYEIADWLKVIWLCEPCHKLKHIPSRMY